MIRKCTDNDLTSIYAIINDAAQAYKGIIPADRWHEPYMPMKELQQEIADGVEFWGYDAKGELAGIMGIQDRGDVELIRHAYIRTILRNQGIGSRLLQHLEGTTNKPILIGTWADAIWAICFYRKHGYQLLSKVETDRLLSKYWKIPQRQVETSIVLASPKWQMGK